MVVGREAVELLLAVLRSNKDKPHAWAIASADVKLDRESPVTHGRVVGLGCFVGLDVDFGAGAHAFVSNADGALDLLREYFADPTYQKVVYSFSDTSHLLWRAGVELNGLLADVQQLARGYETHFGSWEKNVEDEDVEQYHPGVEDLGVAGTRVGEVAMTAAQRKALDRVAGKKGAGARSAPKPSYELEYLAQRYLQWETPESTAGGPDAAGVYSCTRSAEKVLRLYEFLRGHLEAKNWFTVVHGISRDAAFNSATVADDLRAGRDPVARTGHSEWHFVQKYQVPFVKLLAKMERRGIPCDASKLALVESKETASVTTMEAEVMDWIRTHPGPDGKPLNPECTEISLTSRAQLQQLLFGMPEEWKGQTALLPPENQFQGFVIRGIGLLPPREVIKDCVTPKGAPSTKQQVLQVLAGKPEVGKFGLAYQQLVDRGVSEADAEKCCFALSKISKLSRLRKKLGAYARPLQAHTTPEGRVHARIAMATSTGRLSCCNPNLQSVPRGAQIRSCFAAPAGQSFVVADYSQLELRIFAHMTNEDGMIETLHQGGDLHSETAVQLFPKVTDAIEKGEIVLSHDQASKAKGLKAVKEAFGAERTAAKVINFGVLYGQGPGALGENLGISKDEAKQLLLNWAKKRPRAQKWIEGVQKVAKAENEVYSLLGRRRTLPFATHRNSAVASHTLRASVNFMIQGSAADLAIASMLKMDVDPRLNELGYQLVLQVHDEFVLVGPEEHAEEALNIVGRIMSNPFDDFQLRVPLVAEGGHGNSWSDAAANFRVLE